MELAYRVYGEGVPVIILHGLFGQSDNWNTIAKRLAEENFQVFSLDQRNHGLSDHHPEWTYEAMAHDLMEFITTHKLQKPIIIGHSMGGKTLMYFEYLHSTVASKVVICDIAARRYPPHHAEVLAALHSVDFDFIKTRKDADAALDLHISDFGTKQFLLKNIYWKDTENNIMDWRFNLKVINDNYENISVAIPKYKSEVPCLIIKGEKSNYISEEDVLDFKERYSQITFETILGSGHWVHAEKPSEFYEIVRNFCKLT